MASTKQASISAKLRADRSQWQSDLAGAKADGKKFRAEALADFAAVEKGLSFRGNLAEFKKLEGSMTAVKSAAQSASVFMGMFQKETTRARVEAEAASAAAQRMGIRGMGTEITGLKRRGNAPATLWEDPSGAFGAAAEKTRVRIDGLTRSTLTANQAMMTAKGGATNAGMGMLMLSQGIDDAQYGFKGIVNNIAPLAEALGAGTGLAGALTIAAVGFNLLGDSAKKAWDDMTGETEYQRLMEQNAELQAAHEKRLTTMQELARQSGEYASQSGQWLAEQRGRERDADDAKHAAATQRMELEQELARARTKESGQNELLQKQAAERLAAERRFYEERVGNFEKQGITGNSDANRAGLNALKAELAALKAKPDLNGKERLRMEELPGRISGLESNISSAESARAEDVKRLAEVKQQQELQGIKNRIANETEGQRMAKEAAGAVLRFFNGVAKDAAESSRRANEVEKLKKDAADKEKKAAEESLTRADEVRRRQIENLRASGKGKAADALQRQMDVDMDTRDLIAKKFDPATARSMAEQRARIKDGGGRRRGGIVSTPGGMNTAQFRAQFGDGGMRSQAWDGLGWLDGVKNSDIPTGPKTWNSAADAAKAAKSSRDARKEAAGAAAASPEAAMLKEVKDFLGSKLDQLIQATGKTVGEKTAPQQKG